MLKRKLFIAPRASECLLKVSLLRSELLDHGLSNVEAVNDKSAVFKRP
jgi:hypothetical protein